MPPNPPRFSTLAGWLRWQEQLHPNPIDLGLERVRKVLVAMHLQQPPFHVLTVGGTNGKGSCVAYLDAMLRARGYKVGAYTSPHILRYNERVCVNGREVSDKEFCEAFARVDAARGDTSLTYFEFGTLAALDIFHNQKSRWRCWKSAWGQAGCGECTGSCGRAGDVCGAGPSGMAGPGSRQHRLRESRHLSPWPTGDLRRPRAAGASAGIGAANRGRGAGAWPGFRLAWQQRYLDMAER